MNSTINQHSGIPDSEFGIHNTAQLDLGLTRIAGASAARGMSPGFRRRQRMRARAQWWFDQMRRAVENAVEWKPTAPARPEQTAFDLRRQTEVLVTK